MTEAPPDFWKAAQPHAAEASPCDTCPGPKPRPVKSSRQLTQMWAIPASALLQQLIPKFCLLEPTIGPGLENPPRGTSFEERPWRQLSEDEHSLRRAHSAEHHIHMQPQSSGRIWPLMAGYVWRNISAESIVMRCAVSRVRGFSGASGS